MVALCGIPPLTVFIQLTALGAYSIFGPLEKALIEFLPFSASVEWFILQQSNQCAVMTKHEDVTTQGFCKKLGRLWESPLLFCTYSISSSISLSLKSISEFSGAISAMSGIVTSANRLVAQKADTAYLRLSWSGR